MLSRFKQTCICGHGEFVLGIVYYLEEKSIKDKQIPCFFSYPLYPVYIGFGFGQLEGHYSMGMFQLRKLTRLRPCGNLLDSSF